ncbi:helix-turn-helix domain-containing protein [Actinophytocola algeriensis]|uniref:AraC-like DNA-binding protein n=1 Tax=Actinophytocola algeriensis TaxID=1768010 RepID=A0A7W7VH89_9PSEU|nr:helix-turn-helix domain-containing protein [Actinophytocola algeriensis]MBB4910168.1 AraC-like DNA-binding protein [Actinophytocola algeriensis]MBE1480844.1 AraC-like DNA-binding protein [Actinophytocola algeriensis]
MSSALSVAIQPDERLRPLLTRDYLRYRQPAEDGAAWLAPPSAVVTVIINMGAAFGGLPHAFVAGPSDACGVVSMAGEIDCVEVKLTPLGAYRLFGVPVSELTGEVVDLTELADLRPDRLDEGLLRLADAGRAPAGEVAWVWRRLHAAHGNLPIAALAAEVGWSRRHLVNRFRAQTGLPPKTLARVLRFSELLRRLPGGELSEVAAVCGYYDQAHMNRDFREFAGTTPGAWLARFPSVQYPWVRAT